MQPLFGLRAGREGRMTVFKADIGGLESGLQESGDVIRKVPLLQQMPAAAEVLEVCKRTYRID